MNATSYAESELATFLFGTTPPARASRPCAPWASPTTSPMRTSPSSSRGCPVDFYEDAVSADVNLQHLHDGSGTKIPPQGSDATSSDEDYAESGSDDDQGSPASGRSAPPDKRRSPRANASSRARDAEPRSRRAPRWPPPPPPPRRRRRERCAQL